METSIRRAFGPPSIIDIRSPFKGGNRISYSDSQNPFLIELEKASLSMLKNSLQNFNTNPSINREQMDLQTIHIDDRRINSRTHVQGLVRRLVQTLMQTLAQILVQTLMRMLVQLLVRMSVLDKDLDRDKDLDKEKYLSLRDAREKLEIFMNEHCPHLLQMEEPLTLEQYRDLRGLSRIRARISVPPRNLRMCMCLFHLCV